MAISVFTTNYQGITNFYGYDLSKFLLDIDPKDKPDSNFQLQDIDVGSMMP
jgi:hypothetical protein